MGYYIAVLMFSFTTKALHWNFKNSVSSIKTNMLMDKLDDKIITKHEFLQLSVNYRNILESLIYPVEGDSLKQRQHAVKSHPIYNFLHTYYKYSVESLYCYSPGINISISGLINDNSNSVSRKYLYTASNDVMYYSPSLFPSQSSERLKSNVKQYYEIQLNSIMKKPNFYCFGLHEWAMLYSGRLTADGKECEPTRLPKHQQLDIRTSQEVIDDLVESNLLKCSHFDAWRFFHVNAQPMNQIPVLSRSSQPQNEQAGCIHATMDLFKYAYSLYPLVSSDLLIKCLQIAIRARIIDMRASPYDVSKYDVCAVPICVETMDGRREYSRLQENLYNDALPCRIELLEIYKHAVESLESSK